MAGCVAGLGPLPLLPTPLSGGRVAPCRGCRGAVPSSPSLQSLRPQGHGPGPFLRLLPELTKALCPSPRPGSPWWLSAPHPLCGPCHLFTWSELTSCVEAELRAAGTFLPCLFTMCPQGAGPLSCSQGRLPAAMAEQVSHRWWISENRVSRTWREAGLLTLVCFSIWRGETTFLHPGRAPGLGFVTP